MHYINGQKFMYVIMDRGVTTKVTTLNRVNSMRFLVFAGNNDGIIGYGKGKGADFEIALQKAFIDLKKNLVTLDIDESNTFPLKIQTKFSKFYVKMEPLKGFNCWGSPLFAAMIQLAGFHNLRFNLFSRQKNHYNLVELRTYPALRLHEGLLQQQIDPNHRRKLRSASIPARTHQGHEHHGRELPILCEEEIIISSGCFSDTLLIIL